MKRSINYKFIKRARLLLSLSLFILITLAFCSAINAESTVLSNLLKLQFIPALLAFMSGGAVIIGVLIVFTLLFGRFYCSSLCPLGVFQDIVARVSALFKSKKGRRYNYSKPNKFRYITLIIVTLFFIAGTALPLIYLDPYSIWGRTANQAVGNTLLNNYVHYSVYTIITILLTLSIVVIFSAFRGRLYCNTICPVGAILGLFSKYSLYKPTFDSEKCVKCKKCLYSCKSECIDLESQQVDTSRCVLCFNCMEVCKFGAISFERVTKDKNHSQELFSKERRDALVTLSLLGGAITTKALGLSSKFSSTSKVGVTPPGSLSVEHLKNNCTACHACVSACPTKIIKPAVGEYGLDGFLLPTLNFKNGYCNYDCNECSIVCPNNAIMPISLEEKRAVKIGEAQFRLERCIVHTDQVLCGKCGEVCPVNAIKMVSYHKSDILKIPKVAKNHCIGCGACENVCPALPDKAIKVIPFSTHETALPPRGRALRVRSF